MPGSPPCLSSVRALLVDLSGTVHVGDQSLPGAVEAVRTVIDKLKMPIRFVTNTTKESQSRLTRRLQDIGFAVQSRDVFSCLTAARSLVDRRGLNPMLLLEDEALEDFEGVGASEKPRDSVVVGLAPSKFDYDTMTEAFRLLMGGASLIAIHKSRYFRAEDGLVLGPGCFVSGLEYSSGVSAEVVGKPEPAFFNAALDSLKADCPEIGDITSKEVAMVGDDIRIDVLGAQEAGFQGCLVKTGKYVEGDETRVEGKTPDHVFDSFAHFVERLLEVKSK